MEHDGEVLEDHSLPSILVLSISHIESKSNRISVADFVEALVRTTLGIEQTSRIKLPVKVQHGGNERREFMDQDPAGRVLCDHPTYFG